MYLRLVVFTIQELMFCGCCRLQPSGVWWVWFAWVGGANSPRRSLTPKKKMKQRVTPKTPKRLFPAGCCHPSPLGTLDSGVAVHPYTGIHMWISWTLGLQSIAQACRQTISHYSRPTVLLSTEVVCIIVNNIYLLACNVADNTRQHIVKNVSRVKKNRLVLFFFCSKCE